MNDNLLMPKFHTSTEQAISAINHAIDLLLEQRREINDTNYSHFSIEIEQNRNIEAISTIPGISSPNGFRQVGPDIIRITFENTSNLGKEFLSRKGIWAGPTKNDIMAIEDNLKKIKPRSKCKKGLKIMKRKSNEKI